MSFALTRFPSFSSSDDNLSFSNNSDYDMSDYQNKFASQRNEKSLYMRRIQIPGIKRSTSKGAIKLIVEPPLINKEVILEIFASNDPEKILALDNLFFNEKNVNHFKNDQKQILQFSNDEEIGNALIDTVNFFGSLDMKEISASFMQALGFLMKLLTVIFSYIAESMKQRIADEVTFVLLNILNYFDDPNIIEHLMAPKDPNFVYEFEHTKELIDLLLISLTFIQTSSKNSAYMRNAIVSFGIQRLLVSMSKSFLVINNEISHRLLTTELIILQNPAEIEIETFPEIIEPLFAIITKLNDDSVTFESTPISNKAILSIVMNILAEITNRQQLIIPSFYERGLYHFALRSLDDPELVRVSLYLIGNMCVSKISYKESLLNNGLFEKLMFLIQNGVFISDVFWVLSNLTESIHELILPKINSTLIEVSINIANETSFNNKREIAYFIATLIIFIGNDNLLQLINEQIIDLLSEMLTSGVDTVIIRCVDALYKLLVYSHNKNRSFDLISLLDSCDVMKQLEDIVQQEQHRNCVLSERAALLLSQITGENC